MCMFLERQANIIVMVFFTYCHLKYTSRNSVINSKSVKWVVFVLKHTRHAIHVHTIQFNLRHKSMEISLQK